MSEGKLVDVDLGRIVINDRDDRQYIYLCERAGERSFPIVIGNNEAGEIYRIVHKEEPQRPLTHQLAFDLVRALNAKVTHVDIIDLRHNTFYAQISLENEKGDVLAVVDARPSDAIALALRARCGIRVAETILGHLTQGDSNGESSESDA